MEGISAYIFDLGKEAETLVAEARLRRKDLLIVETEAIPYANGDLPQINFQRAFGAGPFSKRLAEAQKKITHVLNQNRMLPPFHSLIFARLGFGRTCSYIAFPEDAQLFAMFGEANRSLMKLFFLYHEAGHALVLKGLDADRPPLKESAADAYAALRLLQRFGAAAVPFLSQFSWLRANQAVAGGDTMHLTTTVLDKIILDSAQRNLSRLNHDEIIQLARTYAKALAPKKRTLTSAEKIFAHVRKNIPAGEAPEIAHVLASGSLAAQPDNFSFYILAKYAQPFFLATENFIFNGKRVKAKDPDYHAQMRAQAETRLKGMRLRDVFNSKTLSSTEIVVPLTEALKIIPAAQQPFIYQPKKYRHLA